MWLPWLFAYAVPVLSLAFVTWAVATRRLPDRVRYATMAATILIACGAWLLLRQDGINGDHNATFGWRWSPSAEERLLAQQVTEPTSAPEPAPHRNTNQRTSDTISIPNRISKSTGSSRNGVTRRLARLSWTKTRRHRSRREDQN